MTGPILTALANATSLLQGEENATFAVAESALILNVTSTPRIVHDYIDDGYPIRDPLYIVIPFTVIYSIIFITGLLGNIITCIVISRNKSMHTATNYYLFSLAISDLLLLISGLPLELYTLWFRYPYPFNDAICILQGFAAETSANATVLTITAFTVERYVAICKPFLSHTMSKLSRAVRFVLGIWVVAMCLAVPQILDLGIRYDEPYVTCTIKRDMVEHVFTISTILVFVLPMTVITILYILIGLQLRRSKVVKRGAISGSSVRLKHNIFKKTNHRAVVTVDVASQNVPPQYDRCSSFTVQEQQQQRRQQTQAQQQHMAETNVNANSAQSEIVQLNLTEGTTDSPEDGRINYSATRAQCHGARHVVNMLVAVVIAFFLCWAPFHCQRLLAIYGDQSYDDDTIADIYYILTYISGICYYLSTCINPLLYNIMSHKFRTAFKDTLANYLYRRSRTNRKGRLYRNVSQRSYSNNSQSAITCSSICSTQYAVNASLQQHSSSLTLHSNHHQHHHHHQQLQQQPQLYQLTPQQQQQATTTAHSLRYLDSDLAKWYGCGRPSVVIRRIPGRQTSSGKPYIDSPHNLKKSKICDKCTADNPLLTRLKKHEYLSVKEPTSSTATDINSNSLVNSHTQLNKFTNHKSKSSLLLKYDKFFSFKENDDKLSRYLKARQESNGNCNDKNDDSCGSKNSLDSMRESATVAVPAQAGKEKMGNGKSSNQRNIRQLINMRLKKNHNSHTPIKSPYESPKLSDESKELEEKLNKLLEGVLPQYLASHNSIAATTGSTNCDKYFLPIRLGKSKKMRCNMSKSKSLPVFITASTSTSTSMNNPAKNANENAMIDVKALDNAMENWSASPLIRHSSSEENFLQYFAMI